MTGILDIFNDRAFDMVELTQAISIVPNMHGRPQQLNLFPAQPGVAGSGLQNCKTVPVEARISRRRFAVPQA